MMGLGKSAQAVAGADLIGAKRILVICPGVARENWLREFREWQTVERSTAAIYTSKDLRVADVVSVSYAMLTSLPVMKHLLAQNYDLLILDEGHLLKNDAAGRSQSVYGAKFDRSRGIASKSRRVWILSGTPMPNNASELWTHCHALFSAVVDDGRGNRMTCQQWTERYCRYRRGSDKIIGNNPDTVQDLYVRLKPFLMARTIGQVGLQMPPLRLSQFTLRPEKLPPMSKDQEETSLVIAGAMAKASKGDSAAMREAIGALDEMSLASLRKWTGIAKAPAVAELVNLELAAGLEKIVLFGYHSEVFEILLRMIPGSVAIYGKVKDGTKPGQRQYLIDAFQGKVPGVTPRVLLCQIDIASTALTLTAAHNIGMVEQTWVVKDTLQAIKRVHRIGQTKPVLARVFSLKGSIDENIGATLIRKSRDILAFNRVMTAGNEV